MLKCKEFVNSDEIAKGLSPFNSDSIAVAVEASRIMYKRIKELIASGETFAMETTLATRSGANLIREAPEDITFRRVLSAVVTRQVFTISLNYISPFVIIG